MVRLQTLRKLIYLFSFYVGCGEMDCGFDKQEEKREHLVVSSSKLDAAKTALSENSSKPVASETVIEVGSSENRNCNRKDLNLNGIGSNSLDPVSFEIHVTSKITIEMRSEERRSSTGKNDLEETGENSSGPVPDPVKGPVESQTVIEARCREAESLATENRVIKGKPDVMKGKKSHINEKKMNVSDPARGGCVVIDVKDDEGELDSGNCDNEKVCRICHLSSDRRMDAADLIQLGCGCKDELGIAHHHCAEAWFKLKGNRICEICGECAKNITGIGDNRFMEEWNDRRMPGIRGGPSERERCWRGQPFCNFLMACLVIAFILPWFFRVNMF